jgi:hypothetical protein
MFTPTISREEFLKAYITLTTAPPSDSECSICKDKYDTSTNHAAVTFSDEGSCKHVYGQHCIETWLNEKGVNSCAMCRRELFCLPREEQGEEYDEEDQEDEEEEEEQDEHVFHISDADISRLLEMMLEGIFWSQVYQRQSTSLPVPSRSLTNDFLERLSMDVCNGKVDLQNMMRHDQLRRLDAFFDGMRETQRDDASSTNVKVMLFAESKKALWVSIVKGILKLKWPLPEGTTLAWRAEVKWIFTTSEFGWEETVDKYKVE